jgi:hypothetical protein
MELVVLKLPEMPHPSAYSPLTLLWRNFNFAFQRVTDLLEYFATPERSVHRRIFCESQKRIAKAHWYEFAGV